MSFVDTFLYVNHASGAHLIAKTSIPTIMTITICRDHKICLQNIRAVQIAVLTKGGSSCFKYHLIIRTKLQ